MTFRSLIFLAALAATASTHAEPGDSMTWPDWRGPTHDGQAHPSAKPPISWDLESGENILWRTAIHGSGHCTPVVEGGRVWLTTATVDGRKMSVLCLDLESGTVIHDLVFCENEEPEPLSNPVNNYAAPSCAIEPGHVYVHFGSYGTSCLDSTTGEEIWRRDDLPCRHYRGPGSSPFIYKDSLVLTMDGIDVQYMVGLDKNTGKTLWKTERNTEWDDIGKDGKPQREGDARKAYSTPILVSVNGLDQLVTTASKNSFGYDAATGEQIWAFWHGGFSNASRPLVHDGVAFLNSGYGKARLYAMDLATAKGTVDPETASWVRTKNVPNRGTPVIVGEHMYSVDDGGIFVCAEVDSGEELWRERLEGKFAGSPVHANGHIYVAGLEGHVFVLKAAPVFETVFSGKFADGSGASIAVVGDSLLVRTGSELFRIGAK